ncbi:MAG: enoyl-CoA hydratase/isomerase family protein [Dehalococcoidia bacterium]
MQFETILYDIQDDGILWIRLNRPNVLNAVNQTLASEFRQAVDAAASDDQVKIVMVTGEGRAFCAGADLKEAAARTPAGERRDSTENLQAVANTLRNMRKVAIAVVNGYALGAGCEFVLDCDLVIASEAAIFGFPETGVGATITGAGTYLLPQQLGLARAKELVFLGEHVPAHDAQRLGLVNRVVPPEQLEQAATNLAKSVLEKSSTAIALAKACLNIGAESTFSTAITYERDAGLAAASTGDMVTAGKAFQEKRRPRYKQG